MNDDAGALRSRLERERHRRRATERIAEDTTRSLYERQRALELLADVATVADSSPSLQDALTGAGRLVAAYLRWPLAHAWLRSAEELRPAAVWHLDDPGFEAFRAATEKVILRAGIGLPGRVLESGEPVWVANVQEDPLFTRRQPARQAGLVTGLGIPLLVEDEVLGVLECYATRRIEPDQEVVALMGQVGRQLGRAVEREQATDELRRSNAELERFASVASHDLQAPLATLSALLDVLARRHPDLPAESMQILDAAASSAGRLRRLLADLLELARAGATPLAHEPVALDDVVAQARADLDPHLRERDSELRCEPLPTVLGDATQLYRLFVNLLANALKYARAEAPPLVEVSATRDARWCTISVRDEGIGVPAERTERIFEPFHRAHDVAAGESTGIGLAICRSIVERHGGRIAAQRRTDGPGSVFTFTLPVG